MSAPSAAEQLERYRELVFSPLALPSPPAVPAERVIDWMRWVRAEVGGRGLNYPERDYEEITGRRYPWLMAHFSFERPGPAELRFEREFPEVVAYARLFPFRSLKAMAFIAQQSGASVYLHADTDGYWGFRFYLARRAQDPLYFCLACDRGVELPRRTDDWRGLVDEGTRHYARWPSEERAYCVNSVRAAHAVESTECSLGERIACLVLPTKGGIDEERLLRLLEASSARFGAHQIWYPQ